MRFPRSCKDCILVFILKKLVTLCLKIKSYLSISANQSDITLVKEFVLSRKSLHTIGNMPCNGVAVFPVFLQFIPDSAEILWMLKYHDREVWLLHLCHACHPEFCEVVWQHICLKILTNLLQSEPFSHSVLLFCFPFEVVQNIGGISAYHIHLCSFHQFQHVGFNSAVTTHEP